MHLQLTGDDGELLAVKLREDIAAIEAEIGISVLWNAEDRRQPPGFTVSTSMVLDQPNSLEAARRWLLQYTIAFHAAFRGRIHHLLAEH